MITEQPSQFDVGAAPIRAFSSITVEQAEITAQTIHASGHAWHVQAFDDYDGYLSLMIQPATADDKQTAFVVLGTAQRLDLFQTNSDDLLLTIASFNDVSRLSSKLLQLINQQ